MALYPTTKKIASCDKIYDWPQRKAMSENKIKNIHQLILLVFHFNFIKSFTNHMPHVQNIYKNLITMMFLQ